MFALFLLAFKTRIFKKCCNQTISLFFFPSGQNRLMVHANNPTSEVCVVCVSHDLRTLNKLKNIDSVLCVSFWEMWDTSLKLRGLMLDRVRLLMASNSKSLTSMKDSRLNSWYKQQDAALKNIYFYPIRGK